MTDAAHDHAFQSEVEEVVDVNLRTPLHLSDDAVLAAIQERADNMPEPGGRYALAVARNRLWETGKRLRVRFLDAGAYPNPARRIEMVMEAAREWTRHAHLTFDTSDDADAELRVSFNPARGCSSYYGTDAKVIPAAEATINLSIFGKQKDPTDYRKFVLHEFGHAIGCVHEHQAPGAGIQWDKPAVRRYYAQAYGWTDADVDYNVFHVFDGASTNHVRGPEEPIEVIHTRMDGDSIMVYPILRTHTLDGYSVEWCGGLSDLDKAFIARVYPTG